MAKLSKELLEKIHYLLTYYHDKLGELELPNKDGAAVKSQDVLDELSHVLRCSNCDGEAL